MEISEEELEKRLLEAGNKLLSPPSSSHELLASLDLVENLLGGVEQSPSESMKEALVPSSKALIAEELLRHSNADVKVAVASCISEITRITAPEAPYADDQMKEVFNLIVSTFEKLDDMSSPSYTKRASILETVAKVRSCVVMLDLECDDLILEMFGHFFRTIRAEHSDGVFTLMETIMSLVVEESDTISVDLLSSILNVLKKENKEILPIACQLGEKVIVNCSSKLTPYLLPAVRSSGASLDDYCKAVSDVCKAGCEAVEPTDGDAANKNVVAMETLEDAPPSEEVGPRAVGSPKTVMSNGILDKDNDNTSQVAMETREGASPSEEVGSSTVEFPKTDMSNGVLDNDNVNTSQVAIVQLEDVSPSEEVGPRAVESPKSVMGSGILNKDSDNTSQVAMETPEDARPSEEVVPSAVAPLTSVMSNAILDKDNVNTSEVAIETVEDAPPSEEGGPSDVRSPKTLMTDGILDKDNDNTSSANDNSKEADVDTQFGMVEPSNSSKIVADSVDPEKSPKTKPEKSNRRKGKRSKSRKKPSKPSKPVASNRLMEVIDTPEHKDIAKDIKNRKSENPVAVSADAVDNEKSPEAPVPSPNTSDNEHADISLPQSGSLADETCSKKAENENKEDPIQEDETAIFNDAEDDPDGKKEIDAQLKKKATSSKSKLDKHTNKKALSASDQEESVPDTSDDSKKEEDNIDELDSNSTHDSAQQAEVGVSQLAEKKKRGQAKLTSAKSHRKTQAKEEKKNAALPKSTPKAIKDESVGEDALKSSSKRKRPSEEKAPKTKDYGLELVGSTVKVWWPDDNKYYQGVVDSFDSTKKKHKVLYDDDDIEILNLKEEKWLLISPSEGHASDGDNPDESANEMLPKGKKPKTNADLDAKRVKTVSSAKKPGTISSKTKSTPKSVSRPDTNKTAGKFTEEASKKVGKSDSATNKKSTKSTKSGNKLFDDSPKSAKKSKDDNMDTTKNSSKSKQDTSKGASKSKGKTPKSVGKPSSGGSSKVHSATSMDDEETEDESLEPETTLEKPKGKSQSTPKSQKNSTKRKRSAKR